MSGFISAYQYLLQIMFFKIANQTIAVNFAVPPHIVDAVLQKVSQQRTGLQLRQPIVASEYVAIEMPLADESRDHHLDTL